MPLFGNFAENGRERCPFCSYLLTWEVFGVSSAACDAEWLALRIAGCAESVLETLTDAAHEHLLQLTRLLRVAADAEARCGTCPFSVSTYRCAGATLTQTQRLLCCATLRSKVISVLLVLWLSSQSSVWFEFAIFWLKALGRSRL